MTDPQTDADSLPVPDDAAEDDATGAPRWRMITAAVLVVLFAITLALANQAIWLATTVLDTETFVDTLAPLPADDAVAASLGDRFATAVVENNDIGAALAEELPEGLKFIAAPLAESVKGLIANAATAVIQSDRFVAIWETALRVTHGTAMFIIDQSSEGALQVSEGDVILDLNGLVEQVDETLQERGIDVLADTEIDATIVLYETENEGVVQSIVQIVYQIRWGAIILVVVLLGAAVAVASDRRKVTVWLGIGTVVSMLLVLIELRLFRRQIIDAVSDPVRQEGAVAAYEILFGRLIAQTWGLLMLGVVAAGVAWFMGPSVRAQGLRGRIDSSQPSFASEGSFGWVGENAKTVQYLIGATAIFFLLLLPTISGLAVLLTAIVAIAGIIVVHWIGSGSAD
ncbi:MAG: hypothetical protein ACR2N2_06090 [Acidimicrobiia bacterium]